MWSLCDVNRKERERERREETYKDEEFQVYTICIMYLQAQYVASL